MYQFRLVVSLATYSTGSKCLVPLINSSLLFMQVDDFLFRGGLVTSPPMQLRIFPIFYHND